MLEGKKKRKNLLEFVGAWKDMSDEEANAIVEMRHEPEEVHDYEKLWKDA